jgi:hypothetical protein
VALHERALIGIPPALRDLFVAGVSLLIQRSNGASRPRSVASRITQIGGC